MAPRAALQGCGVTVAALLWGCGGGGSGDAATTPLPEAQNPACTADSTLNPDGSLRSRPAAYLCGTYGVMTTRADAGGAAIQMDYFVSRPPNGRAPKAMIVLVAGSAFDTRITGNADGGPATGASGNFLVRSAQIVANGDYLVATLDRPSDVPGGPFADEIANVDQYRISVRHAIDILAVARRVNGADLDLYVIGTSRGSISAVSTNAVANGVAISSPVTRGRPQIPEQVFLGDSRVARLQPSAVRRPLLVLRNELDECDITPPAGAVAFADAARAAGAVVSSEAATGGFKVTAGASAADLAPCESLGYHSFMGIEGLAAGAFVRWLDGRIAQRGGNRHPVAAFPTLATPRGASRNVDLATFATDPDGDALSYSLPYAESSLGGTVVLNRSVATYTPPAGLGGRTDRFVYAATDARGGVGAGVIAIDIGN